MKFKELGSTIKGEYAEGIIYKYLSDKGYIVYKPIRDESHPIDVICFSGSSITFIDIKSKPHRKYYEDTGLDLKDYNKYKSLESKGKVVLIFVDELSGSVYGGTITRLEKPCKVGKTEYPLRGKCNEEVIYFPLKNMKKFFDLTTTDLDMLKKLTRSNYYTYA